MVFTIIGAVAELERSLIKERVVMGLSRARAQGKTLGRPRPWVDPEQIARLKAEGLSLRAIAKKIGVSHPTVAAILNNGEKGQGDPEGQGRR